MTTRIRVWDLAMRAFHWAFALCVVTALVIALTVDDHDPLFRGHMLAGLSAGFLLIIRLLVSAIGGKFARLRGLAFAPAETVAYLKGALTGTAKRYIGHNPGTAAAALGMFLAVIVLVVTGLTMNSRLIHRVHEIAAYVMIGLAGAHLLGIVLYTVRHKEVIGLSMITGSRDGEEGTGLTSAGVPAGIVVLLLIVLWFFGLSSSFDFTTGQLRIPVTGQEITLGHKRKPRGQQGSEERRTLERAGQKSEEHEGERDAH